MREGDRDAGAVKVLKKAGLRRGAILLAVGTGSAIAMAGETAYSHLPTVGNVNGTLSFRQNNVPGSVGDGFAGIQFNVVSTGLLSETSSFLFGDTPTGSNNINYGALTYTINLHSSVSAFKANPFVGDIASSESLVPAWTPGAPVYSGLIEGLPTDVYKLRFDLTSLNLTVNPGNNYVLTVLPYTPTGTGDTRSGFSQGVGAVGTLPSVFFANDVAFTVNPAREFNSISQFPTSYSFGEIKTIDPVPEPATIMATGIGIAALARRRKSTSR